MVKELAEHAPTVHLEADGSLLIVYMYRILVHYCKAVLAFP